MRLFSVPIPRIPFDPPRYVCARSRCSPEINGDLQKPFWQDAPWTRDFLDIEGSENRPLPRKRTRAKMLWDEQHLYIAAELEEDCAFATLTERDSVMYDDNDFEIFLDPLGTTHEYAEIELNALGTVWDLFLTKPYRDGGTPMNGFDIKGLQVAIQVDGGLNNPKVPTRRWCVEMAIPWAGLYINTDGTNHAIHAPEVGSWWRMNFSRVQWRTEVQEGRITKQIDPETQRPYREDNWVWAPTGVINIHYPELWGYVFFQGGQPLAGALPSGEREKWRLRTLYYRQRAYYEAHGHFLKDAAALWGSGCPPEGFTLETTTSLFEMALPGEDGAVYAIRQDGYVWRREPCAE